MIQQAKLINGIVITKSEKEDLGVGFITSVNKEKNFYTITKYVIGDKYGEFSTSIEIPTAFLSHFSSEFTRLFQEEVKRLENYKHFV